MKRVKAIKRFLIILYTQKGDNFAVRGYLGSAFSPTMRGKRALAPLASNIANNAGIPEATDVRNPPGIADLVRRAYSRKFLYVTLARDFRSFSP
jgi:hypothetical protein